MENAHCEEYFSRSSAHFKMTYLAFYVFIPPLLPQWTLLMLVALASFGIFCKYDPATTSHRGRVGSYVRCHQLLTKVTTCCILWESYYRHSFIAWRKKIPNYHILFFKITFWLFLTQVNIQSKNAKKRDDFNLNSI